VTTRILLNKWQCQLEKERYQKRKHKEERRRAEEDARRRDLEQYTREQGVRIGGAPSSGTAGMKG
jgi:hypothetical protein